MKKMIIFFTGTLKVTTSTTGTNADLTRSVSVSVNGGTKETKAGAGVASDQTHAELEFTVEAGNVAIFPEAALRFYKVEFTYTYTPSTEKVKFDWNFTDADWQTELAKWGTISANFTADPAKAYNGLTFYSLTNSKWNKVTIETVDYYYVQFGGSGLNADNGNLDRYFKFTTPKPGTLKALVWRRTFYKCR